MPAEQRGSAYRTKTGWGVRWRENGKRRFHAGHKSRTEALNYYRDHVAPQLAAASSINPSITLEEFTKLYLAHHGLEIESSTLTVLRSNLNAAKKKFGDVPLQRLERQAPEIAAWRATLTDGARVGATKVLRQCLDQAIKWRHHAEPREAGGPEPCP